MHLLVSELYIYQNARCNGKKKLKIHNEILYIIPLSIARAVYTQTVAVNSLQTPHAVTLAHTKPYNFVQQ